MLRILIVERSIGWVGIFVLGFGVSALLLLVEEVLAVVVDDGLGRLALGWAYAFALVLVCRNFRHLTSSCITATIIVLVSTSIHIISHRHVATLISTILHSIIHHLWSTLIWVLIVASSILLLIVNVLIKHSFITFRWETTGGASLIVLI